MKLHDHLGAADPARGLEPVLDDELRRARVEAILAEEPAPAPQARRRPIRRLAVAVAAVAAVATAVGLVRSADDDSTRLPGTAAAFAEQIRRHEGIVHYVTGTGYVADSRGRYEIDGSRPTEAWVALDGSGWRQRFHEPGGEYRDDTMNERGDQLRYTSKSGRLRSWPRERPLPLDQRLGAVNAGNFIVDLITGGALREDGEATVDGQSAHRLVLEGGGKSRYEYFVAQDRVRLLRISSVSYDPNHPDAPRLRMEMDFKTFEILPDTPANRALIQMPEH